MTQVPHRFLTSSLPLFCPNTIKLPSSQEKNHTPDLSAHSPRLRSLPTSTLNVTSLALYKHDLASLQFCLCWAFCLKCLVISSLATRILSLPKVNPDKTSSPLEPFLTHLAETASFLKSCRTYSHLSLIVSWDFNNVKRDSEHFLCPHIDLFIPRVRVLTPQPGWELPSTPENGQVH